VTEQIKLFIDTGGCILACGACLKVRDSKGSETCPLSTMKDLYDMIKWADKVITF
ncbi:MAG: DsrE family protein, partial [Candidatus Omnitrophica bacterium]|nr:DsrE family protein [Candidatus Omnitrophota bacterium]